MDKERMRRLRAELSASEVNRNNMPGTSEVVTVVAPPVSQPVSSVVRSDLEETHDSLPLKRSRAKKVVTVVVPPVHTSATQTSLISGLENLKINSPMTLTSVLYTLSHANRLAAEYAGGLEAEIKGYKDRAKDLFNKNNEANKVIKQEKAALVRKNEEIEKGKIEILRLTQELEAGKVKVTEYDTLCQKFSKLESSVKEKDIELQRLKEEVQRLEIGSLQSYESGYEEALKHLKHVHPEEDLSIYGPFHEIIDGRLTDPAVSKDMAAPVKTGMGPSSSGVMEG